MIVVDKFPGLATNASPYAIPPGAAVTQVNIQALIPGVLTVRDGLAQVSWATHSGTTHQIVRSIYFQNSTYPQVVYQSAFGGIYAAKEPT